MPRFWVNNTSYGAVSSTFLASSYRCMNLKSQSESNYDKFTARSDLVLPKVLFHALRHTIIQTHTQKEFSSPFLSFAAS